MTDNLDGGDLVALAAVSAVALFTDAAKYSEFYAKVKAEVVDNAPAPDTTTAKGRDAIKARAFRVTKAKTALAKTAKDLTEEWRAKTNLVNASRNKMVEELEALADEVRAPVTQWELAEKHRTETVDKWLQWARDAAIVHPHDTADSVRLRGIEIWEYAFDAELFADYEEQAETVKHATVATLRAAYQRLTQEEADKAELAKLRAENEARQAAEAAAAAEKAEADRIEAERVAEERRQAEAAAAQAAAIQKAKDDAAEAAIAAERRKAEEAAAAAQRIADEALAAEKKRADDLAAAAAAATAKAEAEAAEEAKRAKNRAHVQGVMTKAKEAIMRCGVDESIAKTIVLAIKAGEIPAVKMEF